MLADYPAGELCVNLKSIKAHLPHKGTPSSAGFDLFSQETFTIQPRSRTLTDLGIQIVLPPGCYGRLASRSGLAVNHAIEVGAGVIDPDYQGWFFLIILFFNKLNHRIIFFIQDL